MQHRCANLYEMTIKETGMDQIKIGKFIAELRKEQNLTQIDLAEALGVSNKTISKWECGNGMPDYAVMEPLCEKLKISVNELLSGERLPSKDYNKKAEENIMSLIQESSENYKRKRNDFLLTILGIVVILIFVILTIVMWGGVEAIGNFIDIPTFTYMSIITALVLELAGMIKDFGKAFSYATKKNEMISHQQINKSLSAIKTTIITVNVAGVLMFFIALINSLKTWGDIAMPEPLAIWIAAGMLSVVYGLVFTLILTPIYMRLKNKLIEE